VPNQTSVTLHVNWRGTCSVKTQWGTRAASPCTRATRPQVSNTQRELRANKRSGKRHRLRTAQARAEAASYSRKARRHHTESDGATRRRSLTMPTTQFMITQHTCARRNTSRYATRNGRDGKRDTQETPSYVHREHLAPCRPNKDPFAHHSGATQSTNGRTAGG
jgi:hypothetical protein